MPISNPHEKQHTPMKDSIKTVKPDKGIQIPAGTTSCQYSVNCTYYIRQLSSAAHLDAFLY